MPAGVLSAVALVYAALVATYPDERIYVATHWLDGSTYPNPYIGEVSSPDTPNWYALIAPVNTLALRGEDLVDDAKLAHIVEKNESATGAPIRWAATLSLKWRDLTGAELSSADVRHVDFSGAILNRANLSYAWAENAHFDKAQLQGASLYVAQLQGASLYYAQLQGSELNKVQLQGASLYYADLQGASLDEAQLQGASFDYARLQGAFLHSTHLQGASLKSVRLQGALLDSANLQGASLVGAQLQAASFVDACVWRADTRQADWEDTRVAGPETGPKADKMHECDWTAASFAALKQLIAKEAPEGNDKRAAMERIEQSLDPAKAVKGEDAMAKIWAARESETPTPEAYEKSLAEQWRELGCAGEGAPYVLHGLVAHVNSPRALSPFRDQSDAAKSLAAAFLDEAHCAGAHGLSEFDMILLVIAAPAAQPAPKP